MNIENSNMLSIDWNNDKMHDVQILEFVRVAYPYILH